MKNLRQNFETVLPLLLLTILCIWTIVEFMTGISGLKGSHLVGLGIVILNWVAFIRFRHYYKYLLLLTIVLGIIELINFAPIVYTISFGIGSVAVGIDVISFCIGILTYIIHFKKVNELFTQHFGASAQQSEKYERRVASEEIERFRDRFSEYSNETLNNIITETKYTTTAKEAAKQILNGRKNDI